jgi:nucleotide-binding universal stress UspA family protein
MYRNILLAYDGSPDGCEALNQVAMLASMSGAAVRLLAVIDTSPAMLAMEGVSFVPEIEHSEIDQMLDEAQQRLERAGFTTTTDVKRGDPAEQIVVSARESNADLIVLGHRDQGTLARWLNGSVGASILHSPPCSVLVAVKAERTTHSVRPTREGEVANANVREFPPRLQHGKRKASGVAADNRAAPIARSGDRDDPGPPAA